MHLFVMLFTLALLGFISWYPGFIGSHLLGAFGAGMCFVHVPRSRAPRSFSHHFTSPEFAPRTRSAHQQRRGSAAQQADGLRARRAAGKRA